MNKIVKFLIKYIWQFPQMLVAWIWYIIRKNNIIRTEEGTFYKVYIGANDGGVTLGDRIFISDKYHGEYLSLIIAHESGHVKQSLYLGPLYLLVIGIPSLLWALYHETVNPKISYYAFPTEK